MSPYYRTAVPRHVHSSHWRLLSTHSEASSSRRPRLPANRHNRSKPRYLQGDLRSLHPRMIFVRPWDGIQSMVHAFAIIREIESRFGKIQEFVVLRDSDVLTTNMPYMHATFARAEDADMIPLEGKVIQVTAPKTKAGRDGGVGLDDLGAYLDPVARAEALEREAEGRKEPEWGPPGAPNVMDIKLERSGMREPPPALDIALGLRASVGPPKPPHMRNPRRAKELAEAMVAFRGFSDTSRNTTEKRTRMQVVLSQWDRAVDRTPKDDTSQAQFENSTVGDSGALSVEEEIPWSPFTQTQTNESSTSDAVSPDPSPSPPPSQSVTPSPSGIVSPPPTKCEPAPTPQLSAQRPSKKQRLLFAARSAAAAQRSADDDKENLAAMPSLDNSTSADGRYQIEVRSEPLDPATHHEDHKQAARKWWGFLMRGKG